MMIVSVKKQGDGNMAKKRKTLPKEMRTLLERGDMEALKEQFLRCEPNAVVNTVPIFSPYLPFHGNLPSGQKSRGQM